MSPEQANGDAVDGRSDLFSLGSVIYFMATGRAPFRGDGAMAVLNAICHKAPRPATEVNNTIHEPLEIIVQRLLQKAPTDRFQNATELRQMLADYLAHLQSPTLHPLPPGLTAQRRSPLFYAGISASLLVLTLWAAAWPGGQRSATSRGQQETRQARSTLPQGMAGGIVDFDQEVRQLQRSISQLEHEWKTEATVFEANDGWDAAVDVLNRRIRSLEAQR